MHIWSKKNTYIYLAVITIKEMHPKLIVKYYFLPRKRRITLNIVDDIGKILEMG
jgi:hypothetical protein